MNMVWLLLILTAIVAAGYTGKMEETMKASFDSAKAAVNLAIGLIGVMALWLGLMRIAEKGGLMKMTARAIRPVAVRLFPDVPPGHPAMSAMIMNISANAIGLANAATPLGIKAMMELDKLNKEKGTATNAMCLFLAINTSNVALLPTGVMGVRAAAGASNPAAIILPTFLATLCSTIVAIFAARLLSRGSVNPSVVESEREAAGKGGEDPAEATRYYGLRSKADRVAGEYESFRGIQTATVEPDGATLEITLETALDDEHVTAVPETTEPDDLAYYAIDEGGVRVPVEFVPTDEGMDCYYKRWRLHGR